MILWKKKVRSITCITYHTLSITFFLYFLYLKNISLHFISFIDGITVRTEELSLFETETMKNLASLESQIRDMQHFLIILQDKLDDILQMKKEPTGCGFACTNNTFKI